MESLASRVRGFCEKPPRAVLFDGPTDTLFDVPSGKSVALNARELVSVEDAVDRQTQAPYLRLRYGDGRVVALTATGIAFTPSFENTGALPDLPEAVCFHDYQGLIDRLKHELYGHPDAPPSKTTLGLVAMCIAVLDGARVRGFDVSRETRELDGHLTELEKRAGAPAP